MLCLVFPKGARGGSQATPLLWPLQNCFFWWYLVSLTGIKPLCLHHSQMSQAGSQAPTRAGSAPSTQNLPAAPIARGTLVTTAPVKSILPAGAPFCRNLGCFCYLFQLGFCHKSLGTLDLPLPCCSPQLCSSLRTASHWWLQCHVSPGHPCGNLGSSTPPPHW